MRHRHFTGCGPRGRININIPDAIYAMRGGRSWGGAFGPIHFEFGDEGEGGRGRGSRGPRGRRRMFGSGELRLVLLKLIADEPRHGYDLIRAIEDKTGGEYAPSPGVIYPTLTLLQDMGLIEEAAAEGSRKSYAATNDGRAHLAANQDEVDALFERLDEAKPEARKTGYLPIHRAFNNVRAAIRIRAADDRFTADLVHEITEILDDAARRIERVK